MIDLAPNNPYSLEIATPLVAAAGSLGYGVELARQLGLAKADGLHGLGALITRTTTLGPRRARPLPALSETPAGLIWSGAAQNPGLRSVRERFAPAWAGWELPVILSLAAVDAEELALALGELELIEGVRGVELPLWPYGTLAPEQAARLVATARAATPLPLIVKLPGACAEIAALAQAVAAAGADALSLIDGLPATAPDGTAGTLCGPALRPIALRAVAAVCAAVELPVIGGGGVLDAADARALLAAGATAVALGTALLNDMRAGARIAAVLAG